MSEEVGAALVTEEMVARALWRAWDAGASEGSLNGFEMRAALAAVAPDIAAAAVRAALAPLMDGTGRDGSADADDPATLLAREVRRQCAEEHLSAIEYLLSAYRADVFPPDSESRDAIAGTALRTVLTANLEHWRAEWSA